MRISKRAAAVFAVLAGLAGAGFGQQSTPKDGKTACLPQVRITRTDGTAANTEDSLSGTVVDQSGGAIPGAIVTVTSEGAKEVRTTTTNEVGKFEFASLPPGDYSLKVEGLGFLTLQLSNVSVEASKVVNVETIVTISAGWSSGISCLPVTLVRPSHPGTTIIDGDLIRRLPIQ
jgi:protocatechuate 3,4-dioxygenase beta subunit